MSRQTSMLARKVYVIVHAVFVNVTELYNLLFTEVIKLDLFYIECVCIFFFLIFFSATCKLYFTRESLLVTEISLTTLNICCIYWTS